MQIPIGLLLGEVAKNGWNKILQYVMNTLGAPRERWKTNFRSNVLLHLASERGLAETVGYY